MGIFSIFNKKIEIKQSDFNDNICFKLPRKQTKKIKLNKQFIVPENCVCAFSFDNKVYDTIKNAGTYELNGNTLPKLFSKCKFMKPNKKNIISPYFSCSIWVFPFVQKTLDLKLKMIFRDKDYGRQKLKSYFELTIKISDYELFLIYALKHENLNNKKVDDVISKIVVKIIKKFIHKKLFTLSDMIKYTKGFNDELLIYIQNIVKKIGLDFQDIQLKDVVLKDEVMNDILSTHRIPSSMEKQISTKDFTVYNDGIPMNKEFNVPKRQMVNSLQERYVNQKMGVVVEKDNSEYKVTTLAGAKDEYGNVINQKQETVGKYCVHCGKLVPSDSSFCPYCGEIVE